VDTGSLQVSGKGSLFIYSEKKGNKNNSSLSTRFEELE
jgi:hypothetical protein